MRLKWGIAITGACLGLLGAAAPAGAASLGLSATDATVGQQIGASAELTDSPGAVGKIVFEVFGPGDSTCEATALAQSEATVTDEGQYSSAPFTTAAVGGYHWSAVFLDETETPQAVADCAATSTVGKASPGLSGSASAATVGGAIHDLVTIGGGFVPTGEVSFAVFAPADADCETPLTSGSVPLAAGQATSADFTTGQAGGFHWTAVYSGDDNNESVSLACGALGQTSLVAKATPTLGGTASSGVVGATITDTASLGGGFDADGELVFRAFGPGDPSCATAPAYEATVPVDGPASYAPPGFAPAPGLYRWTVAYSGDADNEAVVLPCNSTDQNSAVGTIAATLTGGAGSGPVGGPLSATATLANGAIPGGQVSFKAFAPGDASCSGAPAFSATVPVAGNGTYRSPAFLPTRVGTFRWTVAYSGDPNHDPAALGCGSVSSAVAKAQPTIAGAVRKRVPVGTAFRDFATVLGGYAPGGTVTFHIYGPGANGCAKAAFVNTVAVKGNGTVSSDPFVPKQPGRYSFVASYSGDAENQAAKEPCDSAGQITVVEKRTPKLRPRAVLLGGQRISIRARLSGAASPSGTIVFNLYSPRDRECRARPVFSGGLKVKANGTFALAEYIATRRGTYRLAVGYSGDPRNRRAKANCENLQLIRVGAPG